MMRGNVIFDYVRGEHRASVITDRSDHNGIGATPAEALLNAATLWVQYERDHVDEPCPKCKTGRLVTVRDGVAVRCDRQGCNYWFCY